MRYGILRNLLLAAIGVSRVYIVQRKMLFTGPHFRERILPCYFFVAHVIRHFLLRLFSFCSYTKKHTAQHSTAHQPTESTSFTCVEILNNWTEKNPIKFDRCSREKIQKTCLRKNNFTINEIRYDEFEFSLSLTEWWIVVRTEFIFSLFYFEHLGSVPFQLNVTNIFW